MAVVDQRFSIDVDPSEEIMDIQMGPAHPATHGTIKFNLKLDGLIRYGASPRATIFLTLAAKARAFLGGRGYVTPQDVKDVGADILRHRIAVSYEAEAESVTSESIVERIFAGLQVP